MQTRARTPNAAEPGRSSSLPAEPGLGGPRRLQRMGSVTVGVSLPRSWVGERGLTAGRPVFVHGLPDGSLILRDNDPAVAPLSVAITTDARHPPEHLFRRLVAAYLAGATEFLIDQPEGLTSETRSIARIFARRTGHTEGVSDEGTRLLFRDVSMGEGPSVPQLLHRMFQIVHDLQVDAARSWASNRGPDPNALAQRDDEVDRYAWMIERSLRRGLSGLSPAALENSELGDALQYLLWARDLERIGDHAVSIGENGARLAELSPPDEIRRMLSGYHAQALWHLTAANGVAGAPDAEGANEILDLGEALRATYDALADQMLVLASEGRLPPAAIRASQMILQSIDRTTGYAQNLAEIGLDRDLRPQRNAGPSEGPAVERPPDVSSQAPKRGGTRKV
ncbi:MAG: hypothetical protein L3J97_00250 [Thermoplasmata archaeon]|nr:hypothetical protein [Thermoplasmata archaeon]